MCACALAEKRSGYNVWQNERQELSPRARARASYAKWSTYRGYCGTTQIFARPHSQSVVSLRRQVRVASHVVVWYVGQTDSERNKQTKKSHHHEVNDRVWRERDRVPRPSFQLRKHIGKGLRRER